MPNYHRNSRQEDVSRGQLKARFAEIGWPAGGFERDLGEDIHCRIFSDDDKSTGLAFNIQIKSTSDIESHRLKGSGLVSYLFDVEHLLHWEISALPVVLIIWDVNQSKGCWLTVQQAIDELDKNSSDWRAREGDITLHFPIDQVTDDKGFVILRLHIIKESVGSISNWYMKQFDLTFPDIRENEDYEKFVAFQETGEAITISGDHMKLSERDMRLMGPLWDWNTTLTMGSTPSQDIYPIKLDAYSSDGTHASLPYVELRRVRGGTKSIVLANGHDAGPSYEERKAIPMLVSLTHSLEKENLNFNFSLLKSCPTAQQLRDALPFWQILMSGCRLKITFLQSPNDACEEVLLAPNSPWPEGYIDLISKLCKITEITGHEFFVPDWKIPPSDAKNVDIAFDALTKNSVTIPNVNFPVQLDAQRMRGNVAEREKFLAEFEQGIARGEIKFPLQRQMVSILGVEVDLGYCQTHISGALYCLYDLRNAIFFKSCDKLDVEIVKGLAVIDFPKNESSDAQSSQIISNRTSVKIPASTRAEVKS